MSRNRPARRISESVIRRPFENKMADYAFGSNPPCGLFRTATGAENPKQQA